ncbi:MAG: glycosyltransferase family 39 protein, partial [Chloroflexota bacterium]|nr:glycosyltransferase family 39 protein [Chloroflexota bacterium]
MRMGSRRLLGERRVEIAPAWPGAVILRVVMRVRLHWPVLMVLALFASAAFVVPTFAPIATTDDWAYTRSVEILYHEGTLRIFPVVAATAVSQIAWGTLFYALFGMDFGAVRLSTVVATALGGWGVYALCRELGVSRGWSALGVATYLFNPLTFSLSFTFMTDPHFAAMLIGATYGYVRSLNTEESRVSTRWVLVGSALAGLAFLVRQQGTLIPLAVVLFLLTTRRLQFDRASVVLVGRIIAIPAITVVGYYLWLRYGNDVPSVQEEFLSEAQATGWRGTWELVRHLTYIEAMYLGFFALPVTAAALPALWRLVRSIRPLGWLLVVLWTAVLASGLLIYSANGRWMPYVAQFVGRGGLGPPDVLGSRPVLLGIGVRQWVTAVCAASALILGLALCRQIRPRASLPSSRTQAGLVLAIGLWQVVGVLPPSFHYRNRGGSLDRYLLPLLPFAICLGLWALRDVRLVRPVTWLVVAVFAAYSVTGTRDYLVYMDEVWDLARYANATGVTNEHLDAGSGWDGYHLYEQGLATNITRARTRNGPWWVYFYAKATDSTYVVSSTLIPGYQVVTERVYSSWLGSSPSRLYLLRRHAAALPAPAPQPVPPPPPVTNSPTPTAASSLTTQTSANAPSQPCRGWRDGLFWGPWGEA